MDTNILDNIISSNITPIPSEVLSFVTQAGAADAGEAINTVVFAALANNKVCDLLGVVLGEKSGTGVASSIVFTTGVMDSTLEMAWNYSGNTFNAQKTAMIAAVGAGTTGAWACHYPSGLLVIKKKTNGTSQTITSYKVRKQDVANITFNAGDLEIGAVELKDPTTDVRATIDANGVAVSANRATMPAATTMQNAAVANADGTSLNVQGMAVAIISIVSSPAMSGGTLVNFEITPDDVTWYPVVAHQVGVSGNQMTTTSADGVYRINTAGFKSLSARISGYSAGTVTVKGYVTPTASHPSTISVLGNVPVGGTDGGISPVVMGGIMETTPTPVGNGQRAVLHFDTNQNALVSLGTAIRGEDPANDVMKTEQQMNYTHITAAAPTTTVVKSGAGLLHSIDFTAVATGVITIYDNTAASGTVMRIITSPATILQNEVNKILNLKFTIGCTIVTSTAAQDIAVGTR